MDFATATKIAASFEEALLLLSRMQNTDAVDGDTSRQLQQLPDYTSPPLAIALRATPEEYRSDDVIDAAREAAANGNCAAAASNSNRCQIPFHPPSSTFESSKVGVIFHGGALVDPRGYSVLASILANRYGLPVVVPIFANDLAFQFGQCNSGRTELAQAEFDHVEEWILAGHSFGGISVMSDLWEYSTGTSRNNNDDGNAVVAGLALVASYIRQDVGCGAVDFSNTSIPMALITASNDGIINGTNIELSKPWLSTDTLMVDIWGGTHGQFGYYNDFDRTELLNQLDGEARIPHGIQHDLTAAAIAHVASRTTNGLPLEIGPKECTTTTITDNTASPTSAPSSSGSMCQISSVWTSLLLMIFLLMWNTRRL